MIALQIYVGDVNGEQIFKYQPLKTAAIEGIWEGGSGLPFLPFAIPDQNHQKNLYAIKIPHATSLLNTHEWNGTMIGLKSVSVSEQPPILPVFFGFRIMLGIGFFLFALGLWAIYLRYKQQLFTHKLFLKTCVISSPLGFIALWSGWITAEIGRQPWIVYNFLKTSDAVSKVDYSHVVTGFILIFIVYAIIFGLFYFYYLNKILKKGPEKLEEQILPFPYMGSINAGKNIS